MSAVEHELAGRLAARLLSEYHEIDDRLKKEFHAILGGNEEVVKAGLLLMAEVHLLRTKVLMEAAGWTDQMIATYLYQHADDEAGKP